MKRKNLITALALTLSIGIGVTAYASSTTPTESNKNFANYQGQGSGFGRMTGQRGYEFITNLLKDKFGIKESEIDEARNSGKNMFEVAEDKGVTAEQFKAAMLEEKIKAIDAAVKNGTMSKEDGENLKTAISENSGNCTTPGQMRGRNGGGRGMRLGCRNQN